MSRYKKTFGNITYNWGYDPQLNEYFFEKRDTNLVSEFNDEGLEFALGTKVTLYGRVSKGEKRTIDSFKPVDKFDLKDIMQEEMNLMEKKFIPKDHILLMLAALPF